MIKLILKKELEKNLKKLLKSNGPSFLHIKIKTGTTLMNPFNTLCVIEETTAKLSANPAPIIIPKIRAIKDSKYPGMLLIKSFMLWIKI